MLWALCLGALAVLAPLIWVLGTRAGRDEKALGRAPNIIPAGTEDVVRVSDRLGRAVVQFHLPADLTPAQMSALMAEGDAMRVLRSATADLLGRGEVEPDGTTPEHADGPRDEFERRLLLRLTDRRTSAQVALGDTWLLDPFYTDLVRRGWFAHPPDQAAFGMRMWGAIWAIPGVVLTIIGLRVLRDDEGLCLQLLPFGVLFVGLSVVTFVTARRMPVRTPAGRAAAVQLNGFRAYLASQLHDLESVRAQLAPHGDAVLLALGLVDDVPGVCRRSVVQRRARQAHGGVPHNGVDDSLLDPRP